MCYTYNGILLALQRQEILTPATTWNDLENFIMPSELSHPQNDKYCMIPLMCDTQGNQIQQVVKDRKQNDGC